MDNSHDLIESLGQVRFALYLVFAVLAYIAVMLTLIFRFVVATGQRAVLSEEAKAFRDQAQELLRKAEYGQLKELAQNRQRQYPGDAGLQYYLGMAHFRSKEYVQAKACFTEAMKLDSQWKSLCTGHLAEIEVALKNMKPSVVK
jgi:cytochrome c-type biogenesis protein CcmH/NrfG